MPHHIDIHVGKRIRHRRWEIGMSQLDLAQCVGVRFQQIQKYELGSNRVSASRLWDIADAMKVPVEHFFKGSEAIEATEAGIEGDLLSDKEAVDLVRSYYAIPERQRRRLFELARALSNGTAH